jgi:pterin-4a-carbinolamine dehydratase
MQASKQACLSTLSRGCRTGQLSCCGHGYFLATKASTSSTGLIPPSSILSHPSPRYQSRRAASSTSIKSPRTQELSLPFQAQNGAIQRKVVLRTTPKALENGLEKHLRELPLYDGHGIIGGWYLDQQGDAIHYHFTQRTEGLDQVEQTISNMADGLKHHPHVFKQRVSNGASGPGTHSSEAGSSDQVSSSKDVDDVWLVTVTCTTHQPRGLSVRDVRLARALTKALPASAEQLTWEPTESIRDIMHAHVGKHRSEIECAVCRP